MPCQRCKSERILSASGKSGDLNGFQFRGMRLSSCYVLRGCNIGSGDYYEFTLCLECGQIQGEWPVPDPEDYTQQQAFEIDASLDMTLVQIKQAYVGAIEVLEEWHETSASEAKYKLSLSGDGLLWVSISGDAVDEDYYWSWKSKRWRPVPEDMQ